MVAAKYPDLAEEIVRFLELLPTTISNEILMFVLMYAADEDLMDYETYLPMIRESLTKAAGTKKMGATLRTIAALDHILPRSAEKIRSAKVIMQNASKLNQETVDRFLAGHPLRQKHYDLALADWTKLRTTLLTRQNLSDYEDRLLAPRLVRRDTF